MKPCTRPLVLAALLACTAGIVAAPIAALDRPAEAGSGMSLGATLDGARADGIASAGDAPGAWFRLPARWADVEREPGVYDWSGHAPAVAALHGAGHRVVLALGGPAPAWAAAGDLPATGEALEAWLGFARSAVRSLGGGPLMVEVWDGADAVRRDAGLYAFMLKQSALALRAEASSVGAPVLVAQAALPRGALDWQRRLWASEVAAYIDVLPFQVAAETGADALSGILREMTVEALRHPPAPRLVAHVRGGPGSGWTAAGTAVAALAGGCPAALLDVAPDAQAGALAAWTVNAQRLLGDGFAPAPAGRASLTYEGSGVPAGARVLGAFFRGTDFSDAVFFRAPFADEGSRPSLLLDAPVVRNARLIDPARGTDERVLAGRRSDGAPGRELELVAGDAPVAAVFQKQLVTPGLELAPEQIGVDSARGLTAEEIIARHQEVQREQDDRLDRWTAKGRIDFHFKVAQGGATVDFSIDSRYFWERGGQLEWEQTDYYVNGNKVKWKNIPELPLIQPEKVVTLPLDLTLDRTYRYRLTGEDRIDGRDAYVLEFQPDDADSSRSLYRGRVWIDKGSFVRLRASILQTRTAAPVLANEEVDRFAPQQGPGGEQYWMFEEIDGQQVWNAAGRNFIVRRELRFSDFRINPPKGEFDAERSRAYASDNQMLRDTDDGFRYLAREDDGSRTVKLTQDTSQLSAAAGLFRDGSQDGVIPLAGVNYFNYDFRKKGIQVNALFAGVLGFFTVSKPELWGHRIDATLDATLVGIKGDDKFFAGDDELLAERLESRTQRISLRLGVPAGKFVKVNLVGAARLRQYFDDDEADDLIATRNDAPGATEQLDFLLPEDHVEWSAGVEATFDRRGYSLSASGRWAHRSDWERWGLRDTLSGNFGSLAADGSFSDGQPEPVQSGYSRWRVGLSKEWYLPKFQKLRFGADYLGGSDLDRFSRYQFSFFGDDRLNGFSGSGVRFDDGWIGRAGYAFNLFEVIRFDVALDRAAVEDERSGFGEQEFTGLGLSANFVGPWKTIISAGYGRAVQSDIPDLEGEQEYLLLVFKLF